MGGGVIGAEPLLGSDPPGPMLCCPVGDPACITMHIELNTKNNETQKTPSQNGGIGMAGALCALGQFYVAYQSRQPELCFIVVD